jgi:phage terminase large subunit GpA-like protein
MKSSQPKCKKEEKLMAKCEHCGNEYDKTFEIRFKDKTHVFDSFECAIHVMAPLCSHCGCRIIGHGVESGARIFCCANCAREGGESRLCDRQ